MNVERINSAIENYLNQESFDFDWNIIDEETENEKEYFAHIIERLIHSYEQCLETSNITNDYLLALRNYLIVFQTSLYIKNTSWINENKFGLKLEINGKVFAALTLGNEIKEKFVKEAFQIETVKTKITNSKYLLNTNDFIKNLMGDKYGKFRSEAQKLSVIGVLRMPEGYSGLVVLPTGGGKSLITQTLAYQKDGLTIVIVPTISLAQDQEISAKKAIDRITNGEIYSYSSGANNGEEIIEAINNKKIRLLFISPESLIQNEDFSNAIMNANRDHYLKNIIIDEAHIVVEWGAYFRTDYQALEPWRKKLIKDNPGLKTILLSATVDDRTSMILKKMFSDQENWIEFRCDALRKEPRYIVIKAKSYEDKKLKVLDLVRKLPHPMIIYTSYPQRAENIKDWLINDGFVNVETYTGNTKNSDREILLRRWKNNEFSIMIATSAFGMGVDKPDVRTVLHEFVPDNPNLFYQELGRGGRDGLPCLSVICIYPDGDMDINSRNRVLTVETAKGRWESMYNSRKSKRVEDYVYIDTKIRPNYNLTYVYDEASSKDVNWNIYLLLLLRRYDLIDILDMQYIKDENRYIFKIHINDERLQILDEKTEDLLQRVRDSEKTKYYREFKMLRDSINNCEKRCFSEMFYDTYSRVSEYCAGCNEHNMPIYDDENRFELHSKVTDIKYESINSYNFNKQAYVISEDAGIVLSKLNNIDTLVANEARDTQMIDNSGLLTLNFYELRKLYEEKQTFYLSGVVCIVYSNDPIKFKKEFSTVERCLLNGQKVIHILSEDYIVDNTQKRASSYIGTNITKEILEG